MPLLAVGALGTPLREISVANLAEVTAPSSILSVVTTKEASNASRAAILLSSEANLVATVAVSALRARELFTVSVSAFFANSVLTCVKKLGFWPRAWAISPIEFNVSTVVEVKPVTALILPSIYSLWGLESGFEMSLVLSTRARPTCLLNKPWNTVLDEIVTFPEKVGLGITVLFAGIINIVNIKKTQKNIIISKYC